MTIQDITQAVAEEFGVTTEQLLSADKRRFLSDPRQITYWFANRKLGLTTIKIGEYFGRSHATVIHGVKAVGYRIGNERGFYERIKRIKNKLNID